MVPGFLVFALVIIMTDAVMAEASLDSVTSTVRVDQRSGKLVRRVVVPEKVITAKLVEAQTMKPGETVNTNVGTKNQHDRRPGLEPLFHRPVTGTRHHTRREPLQPVRHFPEGRGRAHATAAHHRQTSRGQ